MKKEDIVYATMRNMIYTVIGIIIVFVKNIMIINCMIMDLVIVVLVMLEKMHVVIVIYFLAKAIVFQIEEEIANVVMKDIMKIVFLIVINAEGIMSIIYLILKKDIVIQIDN